MQPFPYGIQVLERKQIHFQDTTVSGLKCNTKNK